MKTPTILLFAIQGFRADGSGFASAPVVNIPHGDGASQLFAELPGGALVRIGSDTDTLAAARAAIKIAGQDQIFRGGFSCPPVSTMEQRAALDTI